MCGHAGYIRIPINNPTPTDVKSAFVNLFVTSQLRGFDSSGAAGIWRQQAKAREKKPFTGVMSVKDIDNPVSIYRSLLYYVNERCSKRKTTHESPYLQAVIAHSRAATLGNVTAKNAHPFSFHNNRFIGAHNGTITNAVKVYRKLLTEEDPLKGTLPTENKYEDDKADFTDSEIVLYCIYRWGIKKVYPLLDGAWAFVWYDEATGSIYFCRNPKRTLFYGWSLGSDTLFYSSEYRMLEFGLDRELNDFKTVNISAFEVGKLYRLNVVEHRYIPVNNVGFPWDSVEEIEEARPAGTSNFLRSIVGGKPQGQQQLITNGQSKANSKSGSKKAPSSTYTKKKPIHVEVHEAEDEEDTSLDHRETHCKWCDTKFNQKKNKRDLVIKGHGYACSSCTTDVITLEEIINNYPSLSDDPQWMQAWMKASAEEEKQNQNAN